MGKRSFVSVSDERG